MQWRLSPGEYADWIGKDRSTVYRRIKNGVIPRGPDRLPEQGVAYELVAPGETVIHVDDEVHPAVEAAS